MSGFSLESLFSDSGIEQIVCPTLIDADHIKQVGSLAKTGLAA
jgi:hypothetical protein